MNEVTERQGHRAEEILERQNRPREMEAGQEMRKARCERALLRCRLMAGRDLCLHLWLSDHSETTEAENESADDCGWNGSQLQIPASSNLGKVFRNRCWY
jgi:hypothetical protein